MIQIDDETGGLTAAQLTYIGRILTEYAVERGLTEGLQDGLPLFSLVFMGDDSIRELNREHRGLDEATDVLSYPVHEPDDVGFPQLGFLGDVLISVDTAMAQAAQAGHDLLSELLVLAVHGLTHLQGYDHQTEEEWRTFEAAQSRILSLGRADRS